MLLWKETSGMTRMRLIELFTVVYCLLWNRRNKVRPMPNAKKRHQNSARWHQPGTKQILTG
ncbi:hypothetical protein CFP56_019249 [Quercus suber]|uniref:Ribosomal protein L33 n=1 Tax=Quercus suber TaxID=58331 RepID=A0AAW0KJE9_QUESU